MDEHSPWRVHPDDVQMAEIVAFGVQLVVAGAAFAPDPMGCRWVTQVSLVH